MSDYDRIARVIRYIGEHCAEQPDLKVLAGVAGLSLSHFHRLFSRWAGVTPKDFLQCLTLEHARARLLEGRSVLDSALHAGLSGPGRLHDLCIGLEAATPGEIKAGGAGWNICVGIAASPFGNCLIAESPRGICHLSFFQSLETSRGWKRLEDDWPNAELVRDDRRAGELADRIFVEADAAGANLPPLKLFVRGTAFQLKVWRALLDIPEGRVVSYGMLAEWVGKPTAARAVGSAVGNNPIGYLIPCHRVIRESGGIGGYAWGAERKQAILTRETIRNA